MSRGWRGEPRRHQLAAYGVSTKAGIVQRLEAWGMVRDRVEFPESQIDYWDAEGVFVAFWVASLGGDWSNFDFDQAFEMAEDRFRRKLAEHGGLGSDVFLAEIEEVGGEDLTLESFVIETNLTRLTKDVLREGLREELAKDRDYRDYVWDITFDEYRDLDEDQLLEAYEGEGFVVPKDRDLQDYLTMKVSEERIVDEWLLDDYMEARLSENFLSYGDKVALAKVASEYMWGEWGGTSEYRDIEDTYEKLVTRTRNMGLQEKISLMDSIVDARHVSAGMWDDEISDVDELREEVESVWRRHGGPMG